MYDFEQMGDGEPIEKDFVCQPVPEVASYPVACALPSSGYDASEGATGCGKRMTQKSPEMWRCRGACRCEANAGLDPLKSY